MPRSTARDPHALKTMGVYDVKCFDKDGNLKWEESCDNAVYDGGEQLILDIALRGAAAPASWYIGLLKNSLTALPAETTTMTGLTLATNEPASGTEPGYARQAVNRDATAGGWPTLALDAGDYMATSRTVTFTASGAWTGTIRHMFLTTTSPTADATGVLVSAAQLSQDRLLANGDSLNVTYRLKLQ